MHIWQYTATHISWRSLLCTSRAGCVSRSASCRWDIRACDLHTSDRCHDHTWRSCSWVCPYTLGSMSAMSNSDRVCIIHKLKNHLEMQWSAQSQAKGDAVMAQDLWVWMSTRVLQLVVTMFHSPSIPCVLIDLWSGISLTEALGMFLQVCEVTIWNGCRTVQGHALTWSLISCSCCCSFCTSPVPLSWQPLFMIPLFWNGCGGAARMYTTTFQSTH